MPKVTKDFDQAAYTKAYHKEHYKKLTAAFTKEEAERVEAAAAAAGMTKSAFIKRAVMQEDMTRLELMTLLLSIQALLESDNVDKAKEVIQKVISETERQ